MQSDNKVRIRKRTQIASENRVMFMWVAGVSVVVGFAVVAAMFLTQMLLFNERVLHEKEKTVATLDANIKNVDDLTHQVSALEVNSALSSVKANPDDKTLQVILDALPSDANSLALGASLQNKLLANIGGLTLNSLQVDPVAGVESLDNSSSVVNASTSSDLSPNQIAFRFSVNGDDTALKQVLVNLEKSIRTINVTSLKIESQGSTRMLNVEGVAFYEPEVNINLTEKVVK